MKKNNLKYYAGLILLTSSLALTGCSFNVIKDRTSKTLEKETKKELENLANSSIKEIEKYLDKIQEEEDNFKKEVANPEILDSDDFKSLTDFTITYNEKYANYSVVGKNEKISISCENRDIMNIGYLLSKSNCTNLKIVNIKNSELLEEISRCKSLKSLAISDSQIYYLDALKECKNLEDLTIWNCTTIENITPLQELTNLTNIAIIGTKVSDVTALSKLPNLTKVSLRCNEITNPEVLASLPNLKSIVLEYNKIANASQLKEFKEKGLLTEDEISGIVATSTSSSKIFTTSDDYLEKACVLNIVYFDSKQQYFIELNDENGKNCAFMMTDDLSYLFTITQKLSNFQGLHLINCPDDYIFNMIINKDKIEGLIIEKCDFSSLEDLSGFYNMTYLQVDTCPNLTEDFSVHPYGIYNLDNLETVIIRNTNIESLDNLRYIPSIKGIELLNNNIDSYTFLIALPNLEVAHLSTDTTITDVSILEDLAKNGVSVQLDYVDVEVPEKGKEYTKTPE